MINLLVIYFILFSRSDMDILHSLAPVSQNGHEVPIWLARHEVPSWQKGGGQKNCIRNIRRGLKALLGTPWYFLGGARAPWAL